MCVRVRKQTDGKTTRRNTRTPREWLLLVNLSCECSLWKSSASMSSLPPSPMKGGFSLSTYIILLLLAVFTQKGALARGKFAHMIFPPCERLCVRTQLLICVPFHIVFTWVSTTPTSCCTFAHIFIHKDMEVTEVEGEEASAHPQFLLWSN